jgi:hypothetical protein
MFVAAEIIRGRHGTVGLTRRFPWIVAFTFGLLHGFGFAGALSEVGLPHAAIPIALLCFNVGVELGQLLFIGSVLGALAVARWIARRAGIALPGWGWRVPPYAIGAVAAFWLVSESCCFDRTTKAPERDDTHEPNEGEARNSVWLAIALGAMLALPAAAQTTDIGTLDKQTAEKAFPGKAPYSPYAGRNFPTRPFFGDTHLHTSFSMDAGAFGARLGPRDAYVFAKGSEITASSGQRVKLSRPLIFSSWPTTRTAWDSSRWYSLATPRSWRIPGTEMVRDDPVGKGADAAIDIIISFGKGAISKAILPVPGTPAYRDAWQETIKAAEEANDPGRFTAFIGYEWTSNTGGNNLHRNIIFRDNGTRASQVEPYTTQKPLGSDNPRDLWKWMTAYEEKTGGQVLAIAHNGNLSNGRMFPLIESFTGKPIDREYAQTRAHRERLYEVTQIKGDGETHPFLSPNDEFANYERWDKGNLDLSEAKTKAMLEFEYARAALRNG